MIIIAMMFLSLGTLAQSSFPTTGGWFNTSKYQYMFTKHSILEIHNTINKGGINPSTWYTLTDGVQVQILHAQKWDSLLLRSYQVIDNTVTKDNLSEAINASEEVNWDNNMPPTKNSYWSTKTNDADFVKDYTGAPNGYRTLCYKKNPTVKLQFCANTEEVEWVYKVSSATIVPYVLVNNNPPAPIVIHDTMYVQTPAPQGNGNNNGNENGQQQGNQYANGHIVGSGAVLTNCYNQPVPYYPNYYQNTYYGFGFSYGYSQPYYYGNNYINNSVWVGSGAVTYGNKHHGNSNCGHNNHFYGHRK